MKKKKQYPDVHITDIDYADDIAVISNSLIDANKLLNKFEDTARDIGLHIKSDNTEYMCLNHENQINMNSLYFLNYYTYDLFRFFYEFNRI